MAYINITNPNQQCPQGLQLIDYSIRSCGRTQLSAGLCSSVMFPVGGVQYRQVCGRAIGYRFVHNYTHSLDTILQVGILSMLHMSMDSVSRMDNLHAHISGRLLVVILMEPGDTDAHVRCPCDEGNTFGSPPFVGNDYFCDSVATSNNYNVNPFRLHPDNALWDGQSSLNTCYNNNNPPWFTKTLSTPTTDDIELQMCFYNPSVHANIGLQLMEIYIS